MSNNADILRAFLEHPDRPAGTLTYAQLQGFLFAIAGAPEPILPTDWIPEAVGGGAVQFEDSDAGAAAFMALVHESQAVDAASLDGGMPPGCVLRDDPIANLEEDAPIREWARGFARGYGWLQDTWDEYLPAESDDPREQDLATELSSSVMVLSFFASPAIAEALVGEALDADLPTFAAEVHALFPDALRSYAGIGQAIQMAWEQLEPKAPYQRESPKIGRNDPCPCGSGRKYKRCCGAAQ